MNRKIAKEEKLEIKFFCTDAMFLLRKKTVSMWTKVFLLQLLGHRIRELKLCFDPVDQMVSLILIIFWAELLVQSDKDSISCYFLDSVIAEIAADCSQKASFIFAGFMQGSSNNL